MDAPPQDCASQPKDEQVHKIVLQGPNRPSEHGRNRALDQNQKRL